MSLNLFMFFIMAFIGGAVLNGIMEGNTGLGTTELSAALTATATSMTVRDTAGLRDAGLIQIDDETICYTGTTSTTITGLTRGAECRSHSKVASHSSGARVYSEAPGIINTIVGFDIASAFSDGGLVGLAKGVYTSFKNLPGFMQAMARMIMWDYEFLTGPYVYVKYFLLFVFSGGLVLAGVRLALGR